jgi:hypothetical protein
MKIMEKKKPIEYTILVDNKPIATVEIFKKDDRRS